MAENKSGYDVRYEFEYKGKQDVYYYDIPFETFMEGVVKYFDNHMITIDGKDNDVWNALSNLDCLDNIFDEMEDWFIERCEKDAYEAYKDYVDWYYEDEDESEHY